MFPSQMLEVASGYGAQAIDSVPFDGLGGSPGKVRLSDVRFCSHWVSRRFIASKSRQPFSSCRCTSAGLIGVHSDLTGILDRAD